ncbi:MAG: adenylate/guanylate cyclase domain-containing protein [Candidatus Kapaibacteriota bacterium]
MMDHHKSTRPNAEHEAFSEKPLHKVARSAWAKNIDIAPVPEQYRMEFISRMVKHNFYRNFQAVKIGMIVIIMVIFIVDVLNIPGLPKEELMRELPSHIAMFITVVLAFLTGRYLQKDKSTSSMRAYHIWGNFFPTFISLFVYWFLYNLGKNASQLHILGPFAAFIGLLTAGQYATKRYAYLFVLPHAIAFTIIFTSTSGDMKSLSNGLFTGNVILVVAAYSSYMLFKKFRQEFAMTKRMEEERRKAEELNEQLGEANEEISQQIEILNEQAREIELSNITLQEQYLTIEQDRKELERSNARLDIAHEQSESLLLNILPAQIALRLKTGERAIADKFDSVTVLFADIVGFTKLSARTTPEALVEGLNAIFGRFDELAKKYNIEKIKTIGDAYMVAGGLPERSEDHAERVALFALDILAVMQDTALRTSNGETVQIRIGIHTGDAVAGVIGTSKFSYDLWGDTVNTASRMESHGEAGRIHVSEAFYESVKGTSAAFTFEERGEIEVKGKGVMRTWFLHRSRIEK